MSRPRGLAIMLQKRQRLFGALRLGPTTRFQVNRHHHLRACCPGSLPVV